MSKKYDKKLTEKQQMALDLMTSGLGMKYKDIAAAVGVSERQLCRWRTDSDFDYFQAALKERNDARWAAVVDAARESALRLALNDNAHFVEYVLKNEGYNPTQKVSADVDVNANITFIDDMQDKENEDTAE